MGVSGVLWVFGQGDFYDHDLSTHSLKIKVLFEGRGKVL